MQKLLFSFLTALITTISFAQKEDAIDIRIKKIDGNVYFLDCINGFGGGNVVASIGEDGILLVDDMFAQMSDKLKVSLATISKDPVKIILNTHFHQDHIQGNRMFQKSAVIIGHENVSKRLIMNDKPTAPTLDLVPAVTFTDSLQIKFNGEEIKMIHYANGHSDGDAVIYFTKTKVLHLGDMFFFEMFPAVYTEGGGDIKQMVISLDKIMMRFPADTYVIPGHGNLATMQDLKDYVAMLKETISLVEKGIKAGQTLEQMKSAKILSKYDKLGDGGAQTTDQYLGMLFKLLS